MRLSNIFFSHLLLLLLSLLYTSTSLSESNNQAKNFFTHHNIHSFVIFFILDVCSKLNGLLSIISGVCFWVIIPRLSVKSCSLFIELLSLVILFINSFVFLGISFIAHGSGVLNNNVHNEIIGRIIKYNFIIIVFISVIRYITNMNI